MSGTISTMFLFHLTSLCHISGGFAAGFCMAAVTSPIDVAKTRLMNQQGNKYSGLTDCLIKVRRNGFEEDGC